MKNQLKKGFSLLVAAGMAFGSAAAPVMAAPAAEEVHMPVFFADEGDPDEAWEKEANGIEVSTEFKNMNSAKFSEGVTLTLVDADDPSITYTIVVDESGTVYFDDVDPDHTYTMYASVEMEDGTYTIEMSGNSHEGFELLMYPDSITISGDVEVYTDTEPESVKITLKSGGTVVAEQIVTAADGWVYHFTDLDGELDYTLDADAEGYECVVLGDSIDGYFVYIVPDEFAEDIPEEDDSGGTSENAGNSGDTGVNVGEEDFSMEDAFGSDDAETRDTDRNAEQDSESQAEDKEDDSEGSLTETGTDETTETDKETADDENADTDADASLGSTLSDAITDGTRSASDETGTTDTADEDAESMENEQDFQSGFQSEDLSERETQSSADDADDSEDSANAETGTTVAEEDAAVFSETENADNDESEEYDEFSEASADEDDEDLALVSEDADIFLNNGEQEDTDGDLYTDEEEQAATESTDEEDTESAGSSSVSSVQSLKTGVPDFLPAYLAAGLFSLAGIAFLSGKLKKI